MREILALLLSIPVFLLLIYPFLSGSENIQKEKTEEKIMKIEDLEAVLEKKPRLLCKEYIAGLIPNGNSYLVRDYEIDRKNNLIVSKGKAFKPLDCKILDKHELIKWKRVNIMEINETVLLINILIIVFLLTLGVIAKFKEAGVIFVFVMFLSALTVANFLKKGDISIIDMLGGMLFFYSLGALIIFPFVIFSEEWKNGGGDLKWQQKSAITI